MMQLPKAFEARMRAQLGAGYAAYAAALDRSPNRALRVNTLKISVADFLTLLPDLTPTGLCREGFLAPPSLSPGRDPLHLAGLYYVQEPSAQYPVTLSPAFGADAPVVLDLCAAPGGKSTQLASRMFNRGLLISNEPVPSRAETLMRNFERLGVRNGIVVSMQPDALCPLLSGCCDLVLVDAPCSGEGMFRKEPEAVLAWSKEHVHASALRQRAILNDAARCVRPGGSLIYSTCTFSPEEDEETVADFLSGHSGFSLVSDVHLYPHTCCGEGQYAALLTRSMLPAACAVKLIRPVPEKIPAYDAFVSETFQIPPFGSPKLLKDGRIVLLPEILPETLSRMRVRIAGVPAGELINGRFEPAHALFLSNPSTAFRRTFSVDGETLTRFLAGEALAAPSAMKGYTAVTSQGYCIGFGKISNATLKNHLPKGLRIR